MYWSIDNKNSAWDHRNIKLGYLHLGFDLRMIARQQIDRRFYYYVIQSNGSSIVWWLFEKSILYLAKIEAVVDHWDQSIIGDLEKVYMLLISMWTDFSRWDKQFRCWKVSKNKVLQFVYKIEHI